MLRKIILLGLCLSILSIQVTGCANTSSRQKKGTAIGAAAGAGAGAALGQAIGRDTESTLLGAGIGAVVGSLAGYQVGTYMDKQEEELRRALAQQEAASIQRERDILKASFSSEVFFDFDSASLKAGGQRELQRVAEVLNKYQKTTIVVEGHTDATGPSDYNRALSKRRAETVEQALIDNGLLPERITAVGYGEDFPISSNDARNRRVEIYIRPITKG
jgi:outer membrane protein OmpA-like peptidoglycan-associated protein